MHHPSLRPATTVLLFTAAIAAHAQCDPPFASFTSSAGDTVRFCGSGTVFVDGSASTAAPGHTLAQWIWYADGAPDTTTSPTAEVSFTTSGYHTVQLTVVDDSSCAAYADLPVVVLISAAPDFNLDVAGTACVGASLPLSVLPSQDPILASNGVYWTDDEPFILPDDVGQAYSMSTLWSTADPGAVITDVDQLGDVCIEMEHSYMGDFVTTLTCPNGTSIYLHQQGGAGTFLGTPGLDYPYTIPGTCWTYCFSAEPEFGTWADCAANGPTPNVVPSGEWSALAPGSYTPVEPLSGLLGCPMNGMWTLTFIDLWGADNGSVCAWWMGGGLDTNAIVDLSPVLGTADADSSFWTGPNVINNDDHITASASIEAAGGLAFTYTVMDDFGCSYDTTAAVNTQEPFTVSAGPDQVICSTYAHLLGSITGPDGLLPCVYTLILLDSLPDDSWGYAGVFTNIDGDPWSYQLSGNTEYRAYLIPVNGADHIHVSYVPASQGNSQNGVILLDQNGDTLYSALHGPPAGTLYDGALSCNMPGMSLTWSPTTGLTNEETITPYAYPSVNTAYVLSLDFAGAVGCAASDTVMIQASMYPTIPLVYDSLTGVCCVTDSSFADYRWYRANLPIAGTQGLTCYSPELSGLYTARAYDVNGCVIYCDTLLKCNPIDVTQIGSVLHATTTYNGYTWIFQGDTLQDSTLSTLSVTEPGLYTVIAHTLYGCDPAASIQVDWPTLIGTAMDRTPSLAISPVPNDGAFNVLFSTATEAHGLLRVSDMTGRIVYEQRLRIPPGESSTPVSIDVVSGVYFVEWTGTGPTCAQRIVVR